jgi:opacity protein-like surface antigen
MKRLLAGFCIFVALAVLAVPADAQKVSVGLKAGPNFVTLAGDGVSDVESFARMIGGGFMVVQLGNNFAFQPELLYAQKGGKEVDADEIMKLKLDYIEVPLLLRAFPTMTGRFLPHLLAGPTVAYNSNCDAEITEAGVATTVDCDDLLPLKDWDLGVALGGGVDMAVGKAFLVLDLRYTLGLTSIDDDSNPSDIKHRAFSIMAGFRYPLGGYTTTAAQ